MTPQERDVISGIFDRLWQVAHQPRDPEAERFIAERVAEQPYATYALAQAVHVQEQALLNLQQQVEALQAEAEQARAQPQGGFLSSLFGGGAPARPAPEMPQRGPMPAGMSPGMMGAQAQDGPAGAGAGPWAAAQQRAGGGFLQTAMATATGVAGGMMLGNILSSALGGKGDTAAAQTAAAPAQPAEATPAADQHANHEQTPAAQDPAYDQASYDDGGGDFDGGDWA